MRRASAAAGAAIAASLALSGAPRAQTLPCGDPLALAIDVRWEAPADAGAGITGYALVRGSPPDGGGWPETLELVADTDAEGVYHARVEGFPNDRPWLIAVIAHGVAGESERSNVLEIPALISGPCPGGPPGPPRLLDAVRALERQAGEVRRGAAELEQGLARMRQDLEAPR